MINATFVPCQVPSVLQLGCFNWRKEVLWQLGAKDIATRSKKLLGAPGIATRNKDATRGFFAPIL